MTTRPGICILPFIMNNGQSNTDLPAIGEVLYKVDIITDRTIHRGLVLGWGQISFSVKQHGEPAFLVVGDPEKFRSIVGIDVPESTLNDKLTLINQFGTESTLANVGIELVPLRNIPEEYRDQWQLEINELSARISGEHELQ